MVLHTFWSFLMVSIVLFEWSYSFYFLELAPELLVGALNVSRLRVKGPCFWDLDVVYCLPGASKTKYSLEALQLTRIC